MGKISLSPYEVYKIQRIAQQYPNNPEVIWAALSEMGDEYAQSALQGLTDPESLYGHAIPNSNWVSDVPSDIVVGMKKAIAKGYVNIITDNGKHPDADGTVKLPLTGEIAENYRKAAKDAHAPPTAPIDVDFEVVNHTLGLPDYVNWYGKLGGFGLDIDPRRVSPAPPSVLNSVPFWDAARHLVETGLTTLGGVASSRAQDQVIPSLNRGEQAQLATQAAHSATDGLFGSAPLTREDELTLHSLSQDWFKDLSGAAPPSESELPQILEMPSQQPAAMGAGPVLNALNPAYRGPSSQDIIQLYNPGGVPQTLDPGLFASASRPAVANALIPAAPAVGAVTNFLAPGVPAVVQGIPAGMLYGIAAPYVPTNALLPQGASR